jgi:hypothetical protein
MLNWLDLLESVVLWHWSIACYCESACPPSLLLSLLSRQSISVPTGNGSELQYWRALKHKPPTCNALFEFCFKTPHNVRVHTNPTLMIIIPTWRPERPRPVTKTVRTFMQTTKYHRHNVQTAARGFDCSDTVCRWIEGERVLAGAPTQV